MRCVAAGVCSSSSDLTVSLKSRNRERQTKNKKFVIGWVVIFIAWFLGSFVVHGVLLHSDYMQVPNLFRTEADAHEYFPLMILAHVILSGALVWIYARGAEAKA